MYQKIPTKKAKPDALTGTIDQGVCSPSLFAAAYAKGIQSGEAGLTVHRRTCLLVPCRADADYLAFLASLNTSEEKPAIPEATVSSEYIPWDFVTHASHPQQAQAEPSCISQPVQPKGRPSRRHRCSRSFDGRSSSPRRRRRNGNRRGAVETGRRSGTMQPSLLELILPSTARRQERSEGARSRPHERRAKEGRAARAKQKSPWWSRAQRDLLLLRSRRARRTREKNASRLGPVQVQRPRRPTAVMLRLDQMQQEGRRDQRMLPKIRT